MTRDEQQHRGWTSREDGNSIEIVGLLNNIIGHDRPKDILLGSLKQGRVATSYLFTGDSGIGKRTAALQFARAVNCQDHANIDNSTDACDNCTSCRKISSLVHPDVRLVKPEGGVIKIETIRELQEFLSFAPHEGRKKVVIIDDAELINAPAANAFLKTLEEPPDDSLIILITMFPDLLLGTIRSRCCRVRFSPLNDEESLMILRERFTGMEDDSLQHMVKLSMGRPGLADPDDISGESSILNPQWKDRFEMEEWFQRLLILLRDMMVLKVNSGGRDKLISKWSEKGIPLLLRNVEIKDIMYLYGEALRLIRHFRFNLNTSIVANHMKSLLASRMAVKR